MRRVGVPVQREIPESELEHPTLNTVGKLLWNTLLRFRDDPTALILGSAFLSLMIWGYHGNLELLGIAWNGWKGPGSDPATRGDVVSWVPWDQEWLSFWAGALIVVGIPWACIRFALPGSLGDYGMRMPPRDRRRFAAVCSVVLFVPSLALFYVGAHDPGMSATYPFFSDFDGAGEFVIYELGYLPFFIAIEFIFRGYLLFGLYGLQDRAAPFRVVGERGPLVFGYYAILISMLSYTAWHLGKPLPELWGTLVWGLAAGAIALAIRSIIPIIVVHWLLNVWLDLVIWQGW
jgi:hypothetical protein